VVVLLATAGCSSTTDVHEPSLDLTGVWVLTSAQVPGSWYEISGRPGPTLSLVNTGGGQAIAGCSFAEVKVTTEHSTVSVEMQEPDSMLSCPPLADDPTRGDYFSALATVDHGARSDGELTLTGPKVRLLFTLDNER
jgi:hypothetical protein